MIQWGDRFSPADVGERPQVDHAKSISRSGMTNPQIVVIASHPELDARIYSIT
jgi:hypothetical protein